MPQTIADKSQYRAQNIGQNIINLEVSPARHKLHDLDGQAGQRACQEIDQKMPLSDISPGQHKP